VTTGAGSHVRVYFGFEGLRVATPLQKRLILSSAPRFALVINERAERYEFKVPYEVMVSNYSVKNSKTKVTLGENQSTECFLQNSHQSLISFVYCRMVLSARDARAISIFY